MEYGRRVATISLSFVNSEARAGFIVFGSANKLEGTNAEDFAGCGYTFYAKMRETDYGIVFGGYVASPRLDKDDEYEESQFYIYLNPYKGDNDNIAYTCTVALVDDGEFGDKLFSGALFKGTVKGNCGGTLSELIPEDEEEEEPPKKSRSKNGSKNQPQSSKQKSGSNSDKPASSKTGTRRRGGTKSTNDDNDDILY